MKRRGIIVVAVLFAALVALFTLDLRHTSNDSGPKIFFTAEGHGQLLAGAGQAEIHVPYPVVPAGYGPRDRHEVTSAAQPQMARAIALQVGDAKLTLVSVDLLEIDSQLLEDLKPRLPSNAGEVWVCATHTHSGMGNYDPNLLAQIAGTGRFKKEAREALLDAIAHSVGDARESSDGYLFAEQGFTLTGDTNRDGQPELESSGHELLLMPKGPSRIFDLLFVAAHPTTVPRTTTQLDGDYPARLATPHDTHFQIAVFEGALGDQSISVEGAAELVTTTQHTTLAWQVERFAFRRYDVTPESEDTAFPPPEPPRMKPLGRISVATVEVALPPTEIHAGPNSAHRAASNLVDHLAAPHSAQLSVARLGPLTLIAVPGEPTAAAGHALREAVGDKGALVLGLCNGYVGYIETPDRVEKGIGESPRQYYDASLLSRFTSAASLAGQSLGLPTRNQEPGTRN